MSDQVADEYVSSLADLTVNSKPLINMLTMLAEENSAHAAAIVEAIERHIDKVSPDVKLPILYLIDSIIKNVATVYKPLFTENIVRIFASVFEKVDEKTRMSMFKLRQTWNDVFPPKKLYALDCRVHYIDQHWPNLSPPPTGSNVPTTIHLNPKFLKKPDTSSIPSAVKAVMGTPEELEKKQKILSELQHKRRELELLQQRVILEEQVARTVKLNEPSKVIIRNTPRAVAIPPTNLVQSAVSPVKAKIAPVNSALLEAVKLRDPRLSRKTETSKDNSAKVKKTPESKVNLVEALIRQQKKQSMGAHQTTRSAEVKVPEAKITENEIQQRQMAMLKAPVLGQLNRTGTDDKGKRRSSPSRRNNRDCGKSNNDKGRHKDDKSKRKSSRDQSSRHSSKTVENRYDRKREKKEKSSRDRKLDSSFSPASSDSQNSPKTKKRASPVPPPPPIIGSANTTEELMDIDIEPLVGRKHSPKRDTATFKSVKGTLKSRNYSRRNKERSPSPLDSPPRSAALLPRNPAEIVDVGKDTDLRHVMRSPKKRASVDGNQEEPPNKLTKTDASDVISDLFGFGTQDKDYRTCIRTPPPPMISITPPQVSPKPDETNDRETRNDHNRQASPIDDDLRVEEVLAQAKDQLSNGSVTFSQYNEIVNHVVRVNESQKIKNAQRSKFPELRPWRRDEDMQYERRWRGGRNARGGPKGRGRGFWRDRFQGDRQSPDFMDHDSRSQDAWLPNMGPCAGTVIPPSDLAVLDAIKKDSVQQISIDGTPRVIRFYGDIAVVLLSFSSVKQIHFENGSRRVFFGKFEVSCKLNGPAVPFNFQNNTYMVRLGAPTRELYVDDRFYELHFGDQLLPVELAGVSVTVQLEGPPPEVRFNRSGGRYCLGCVMLIVDAQTSYKIYLDAKPQRFEVNGRPMVLRFKDKLNTVLINEVYVPLKFDGNPVPIYFNDKQHFLRFTDLPMGVVPGEVSLHGMDSNEDNTFSQENNSMDLPNPELGNGADGNRGLYLDMVSSAMGNTVSDLKDQLLYNYQLSSDSSNPTVPKSAPPATALQNLDLNNLLQNLVASGIIHKQAQDHVVSNSLIDVRPVDFKEPKSLKDENPGAVALLYSGMQCASCGVRFPSQETAKYSQHLDWHFRQNRRDRDAARRGASRRWYYAIPDWMQYEEVEDLEERAQNWFETEGQGDEVRDEGQIPSVPAPPHREIVHCAVCHDKFDSFFHEDTEEWHLRNCVAFGDNYYHPVCYEDSLKKPEPISAPPLLAPLEIETTPKVEDSVLVLDIDDEKEDEDMDDVEVVTDDFDDIKNLVEDLLNRVEIDEECETLPHEDDELEVLAVTNKDENKPPIEVIDVPEDGEVFQPPSPEEFDPDITIKQEPLEEMEAPSAQVDQTTSTVTACIDGNVEMAEAPIAQAQAASKIKITFSKSQPIVPEPIVKPLVETVIDPNELQIEEIEPEPLPLKPKKPRIAERVLTIFPAVNKGKEVSGLCSIM